MSIPQDLCGLFGKLPQQADFVSRHLDADFTEYWRAWIQGGLSVSQEQLGEEWLDIYLTSPVWRFALAPGVAAAGAAVGVLIPSVDEVGRYFPLTIAHVGRHRPWTARLSDQHWHAQAEQVALRALDPATGYLALLEALEELPLPQFATLPRYRCAPPASGPATGWMVAHDPAVGVPELGLGLLEQTYQRLLGGYSVWWTEGSEHVRPCTLISAGLPQAGQFAAMLDGDWERWGWAREQLVRADAEEAPA